MEIVLGTYEEYLLGYKFDSKESKLTQSFAAHDHTGSIRCVDVSKNLMASGGADDRVIVYNTKNRQQQCMLTHHSGNVNCVRFTEDHTHLVSGSSDGNITITRIGNWKIEKAWDKAHKGAAILDIAIHPSGKLMLSLGADCSLRTWNLVKGRQAYVINLNSKSEDAKSLTNISWAPCGVRFILFGGRYTEIWSIDTGGVLSTVTHRTNVVSCVWLSDEEFLVGYTNGNIAKVSANDGILTTVEAHASRVKAMCRYERFVVTASSDGEVIVWKGLKELAKVDTGCRITCLRVIPLAEIKEEQTIEEEEIVEEEVVIVVENIKGDMKKREVNSRVIEGPVKKKKRKNKK